MLANILTGLGLSGSAGLNAYLPLLMLGLADRLNIVQLGSPFDALASIPVLSLVTFLLLIEMIADKIPAVDTINDVLNSFIRPAAGSILMSASTALDGQEASITLVIASILTGGISAGAVHGVKMVVRPGVTVSTGGLGNVFVSLLEDILSFFVSAFALLIPFLVLFFILSLIALVFWGRWERERTRRYFPKELPPAQKVIG